MSKAKEIPKGSARHPSLPHPIERHSGIYYDYDKDSSAPVVGFSINKEPILEIDEAGIGQFKPVIYYDPVTQEPIGETGTYHVDIEGTGEEVCVFSFAHLDAEDGKYYLQIKGFATPADAKAKEVYNMRFKKIISVNKGASSSSKKGKSKSTAGISISELDPANNEEKTSSKWIQSEGEELDWNVYFSTTKGVPVAITADIKIRKLTTMPDSTEWMPDCEEGEDDGEE